MPCLPVKGATGTPVPTNGAVLLRNRNFATEHLGIGMGRRGWIISRGLAYVKIG